MKCPEFSGSGRPREDHSVKKLPKAIRRTTPTAPPSPAPEGSAADTAAANGGASAIPDPAAPPSPNEGQIGADAPAAVDSSAEERATSTQASLPDDMAARRRSLAYRMVERYATYSGGIGIIPLPLASVAGVMAINIRMIHMLCTLYGVPFRKDRTRAILVGLAGGATPTGLATATSSTLYFLPATAIIALAVSSVAALTCTRRIGQIFVEHFERGGTFE
jgi:uncharacterized protein (DUF697 family)